MDHVRDGSRIGGAPFRLGVLSERDLDDLHEATLTVLEETGVWVEDGEAIDVFADAGCAVDRDARSVRIPPDVVVAAIHSAPAEWLQCGRDPDRDVLLGGDRVTFTNFCEGLFMIDARSGERRPATTQDVEDTARLSDRLGMIDSYMVAVTASDAPGPTASLHGLRAAFRGTAKHIVAGAANAFECEASIDMAATIAGGRERLRERPIIEFGGCPVSPLRLPHELTEVAMTAARNGIPFGACSMVMAGASAPITLAGALVTHNVEVLATLVLVQSVERGSPFRASSSSTGMDLRVGTCPVGSPECSMLNVGVAQLARRYDLPSLVAGL
jgi:trimethylamine---corrinoid protein Co-methyltransferase